MSKHRPPHSPRPREERPTEVDIGAALELAWKIQRAGARRRPAERRLADAVIELVRRLDHLERSIDELA